jgi:hypothetical protein
MIHPFKRRGYSQVSIYDWRTPLGDLTRSIRRACSDCIPRQIPCYVILTLRESTALSTVARGYKYIASPMVPMTMVVPTMPMDDNVIAIVS